MMSSLSLSRLARILFVAWLQLLYLAQSLVVVDHGTSCGRSSPWKHQCRIPVQQPPPRENNHYDRSSSVLGERPPIGRGKAMQQSRGSGGHAPITAMAFSSTDNHEEGSSFSPSSSLESSSPRSLQEILEELTHRGIVFSPLASRAELEELLESKTDGTAEAERFSPQNVPTPDAKPARQERIRQTEDRLRRRMERRSGARKQSFERIDDSRRPRRRREGGERRDGIRFDDGFVGDVETGDGRAHAEQRGFDTDEASLRRRRRRERSDQAPPSLRKSVTEMADIGVRASRIARRETGKLWKDLVDSTYDDDEDGYYSVSRKFNENGDPGVRRSRRERRRSGFNWQQPQRSAGEERSRQRRRGQSSRDERRENTISPPSNDYYSNKNEIGDQGESLRRQRRRHRREAERRQRQDPYDGERKGANPSPSTGSTNDSFATTAFVDNARSGSKWGKLPIGQILAALDERNIVYSPTTSRNELKDLLLDSLGDNDVVAVKKAEEDIEVIEVESISPEDWKKQQEEKLQQKQKEQEQKEEMKQQLTGNDSNTGEALKSENEPYKDPTTATTSRSGNNFYKRSIHNSYPSGFSTTTAKAYGAGSSARQRWRRMRRRTPATASSSDNRVSESQSGRRIYSPYERRKQPSKTSRKTRWSRNTRSKKNDFENIEDDFDRFYNFVEDDLGRFGDFLADSADNIFWGTNEEEEDNDSRRSPAVPPPSEGNRTFDSATSSRRHRKRHWKDRAEERLDKVLGVHKVGGKTYDRWSEKEASEDDEVEEKGYNAVSYIQGRRRSRRPKRSSVPKVFWEDDDSILSILFGDTNSRRPSPRKNIDDALEAFRSTNTLTVLLRNLVAVVARIVGSVCEWASVRDTIPRQIVFVGGLAAGFVSRPGNRIRNALLAVLSCRIFGEWLGQTSSSGRGDLGSRREDHPMPTSDENADSQDDYIE